MNKDDNALTAIQEEINQLNEININNNINKDVNNNIGPESKIASSSNNNILTPAQVKTLALKA